MSERKPGRNFALPAIAALAIFAGAGGAYWYLQEDYATPGDAADLDQVAFGSRVYGRICANCHGSGLDGQLGWEEPLKDGSRLAPAHSTEGETWRKGDDTLFEVVKFGGETLRPDGKITRMPGFEEKLTDDEIWAVIAFIKSTWPTDVQEAQKKAEDAKNEAATQQ